jgi:ATP-binding cassette subfamily C protein
MIEAIQNQMFADVFRACRLVAGAAGIRLNTPSEIPLGFLWQEQVDAISYASGVRYREIHLGDRWWKKNSGPMLGFIKENRRPVALIPVSAGRYMISDPATGIEEVVTGENADRIAGDCAFFYKPFPARPMSAMEVFRFGMENAKDDVVRLVLAGFLSGIMGLAAPIMIGFLISTIIPGAVLDQHFQICIGLITAAVGASVFELLQGISTLRIQGKSTLALQSALWERLISLPVSFFRGRSTGEIVESGMSMENIQQLLSGQLLHLVMRVLFSVVNLFLLFYYSVPLALMAVALVAVVSTISVYTSLMETKIQREAVAARFKLSGMVLQLITGIKKIRIAGAEKRAFTLWSGYFLKLRDSRFRGKMLRNNLTGFSSAVPTAATIMMFIAMAFPEIRAGLPLGDFISFNTAFGQFVAAGISLSSSLAPLFMIIPIYEQANTILKTKPEHDLSKKDAGELAGGIDISNLSFQYAKNSPPVLKNLSLSIQPGEFVAVVGSSGSGKSTLLKLLLGFEQPDSGVILYDGKPLSMLNIGSVRRQLGVVLQDARAMHGTVFTNIVGASRRTIDDAWKAAAMAGIDQDIREMPMQMHTVVSQGGGTLSGGQGQRLQIARALINNPRILIFDEATSALDNITQQKIQKSLDRLSATRIIIAHRLSTVQNADRIIVLDKGVMAESGTYLELMAKNGIFSDLARRQIA